MKKYLIVAVLLSHLSFYSQELRATVTVNTQKVRQTNKQVFQTLEKSLQNFMNFTRWTDKTYEEYERINCRFLITVNEYQNDSFKASLQIQSKRPIYNTVYRSTVVNINDPNFDFFYNQSEPLFFNSNEFTSNLVSVMSFYAYIILAIDADTFDVKAGSKYINQAKKIVDRAYTSFYLGWKQTTSSYSRFNFVDDLLSFQEYRIALYSYHFNGIDKMTDSEYVTKQNIVNSVKMMMKMLEKRSKSYLISSFFDSKYFEIEQIFSQGVNISLDEFIENLNKLAPQYSSNWSKIVNNQ